VITGGTRPGGGTNLFHSFGQFNVGSGDITTFQNGISFDLNGSALAAGLPTSNILARVTGNIRSDIFGTIQTSGFGSANLFLMNPNGFLFGPNATVNVGGMATFTTADYMRLRELNTSNAGIFYADQAQTSTLTSAPVAAFGFIAPTIGPITVAPITVYGMTVQGPMPTDPITGAPLGQKVALVGGNITFTSDPESGTPSTVTAPGRQIQITSVAGKGEVAASSLMPAAGMVLGTVTLDPGTIISTAGDPSFGNGSGGPISIRGGQFVATGTTIITSPYTDLVSFSSTGSAGDITVNVTGTATIADSVIQTNSLDAGNAGAVSLAAKSDLTLTNSFIDSTSTSDEGKVFAINHSGTVSALGNGGAVTLTTDGTLSMTDSFIATVASDSGNAGSVTATAKDLTLERSGVFAFVDVSHLDVSGTPAFGKVRSGAVTLTGQNSVTLLGLLMTDQIINTTANGTLLDASPITITGTTVNIQGGTIDASVSNLLVSPANGGAIEIRGGNVNVAESQLISVNSGVAQSTGAGGSIRVLEAEHVNLTASMVNVNATTGGGGGSIEFQTKGLTVSNNTDVSTSSFDQGAGGGITVRGAETVTIESGARILTDVVTGFGAPQGTAGSIVIETQNLTVLSGGQLGARALPNSTGNAGNIAVHGDGNSPSSSILIDGTGSGIFSTAEGTGAGGNINLFANAVTLQNGGTVATSTSGNAVTSKGGNVAITAGQSVNLLNHASVSASSTGPGNAGNIQINAGNQFAMTNSSVTTEANHASGGSIKITTTPSGTVQLTSSMISASVLDGTGGGGSVNIDPQFVILQNSQILARAVQGPGGNIFITTNLLLPDANSTISASSQFGVNGTVTIQSPNAPGSGKIQPLGKTPLQATSLLNQPCASLAGGEFSSFTVAGRDSLPIEPGSWLASPLATLNAGMGLGAKAEGVRPVARGEGLEGETAFLSLRQIAPAGFLTQAFALDWSASCKS
jgi:filamentous hemagglutinin family protein